MKNVVAFGASSGLEKVIKSLKEDINIVLICDNDRKKWGRKIKNVIVSRPEDILKTRFDYIIVTSMYYIEIGQQLANLGIDKFKIINYFEYPSACIIAIYSNLFKKDINNMNYIEKFFWKIYMKSCKYTMTDVNKLYSLYQAIKYIINRKIEGDFVECGVWKGGSCITMAMTLNSVKSTTKKIYMYDTYEGFLDEPDKTKDKMADNSDTKDFVKEYANSDTGIGFAKVLIDDVKNNVYSTNYPKENFIFVKGRVEDTIPKTLPDKIALLRLDTDFYNSTKHELKYLFPKLQEGGILIIDDYDWAVEGQKRAVDEYFKENNVVMLLNVISSGNSGGGRIGIKM